MIGTHPTNLEWGLTSLREDGILPSEDSMGPGSSERDLEGVTEWPNVPVLKIFQCESSNSVKNSKPLINTSENDLLVFPSSTVVYRPLPSIPAFYSPEYPPRLSLRFFWTIFNTPGRLLHT